MEHEVQRIDARAYEVPLAADVAVLLELYMEMRVHMDALVVRIGLAPDRLARLHLLSGLHREVPCQMAVDHLDAEGFIRNDDGAAEVAVRFRAGRHDAVAHR